MLREPLLLVGAFFLLFLLSVLYVRLDFSIAVDESAEAKMKVAGYCEKVAAHQVLAFSVVLCGSVCIRMRMWEDPNLAAHQVIPL